MKTMNIAALIGIVVILVATLLFFFLWAGNRTLVVTSFEECAAAGYPIMESYPEQCRTPDGRNFVRDISNDTSNGNGSSIVSNGCAVAGCSGTLCVSAGEASDIVTTCEFRPEYACYREASCEPQTDGKCGWTQTTELKQCLANPPALDQSPQVY